MVLQPDQKFADKIQKKGSLAFVWLDKRRVFGLYGRMNEWSNNCKHLALKNLC